MKLASYNVENLFQRARAMNLPDNADGRDALKAHAEINGILNKNTYSAADKNKIIDLMKALGIDKADDGGQFAILRQNRGHLVKRPQSGGLQIVANGRGDWIGFVDLKVEAVNEVATRMTAKVVGTVNADVVGLIEAESRPSLIRFHDQILKPGGSTYQQIMLIDGNDDRGIDVGIMTRNDFTIEFMRSHVDDATGSKRIFSRDCAEYHIKTPSGQKSRRSRQSLQEQGLRLARRVRTRSARRKPNASRQSTTGWSRTAPRTSPSSAISTTRRPAIRSSRCSRTPT